MVHGAKGRGSWYWAELRQADTVRIILIKSFKFSLNLDIVPESLCLCGFTDN